MSTTFRFSFLTKLQTHWIEQNVGPRKYYIGNIIEGTGWRAQRAVLGKSPCTITFEDDKMATLFLLRWA